MLILRFDRALLTTYTLRKNILSLVFFCACMTKINPTLPPKTKTSPSPYTLYDLGKCSI